MAHVGGRDLVAELFCVTYLVARKEACEHETILLILRLRLLVGTGAFVAFLTINEFQNYFGINKMLHKASVTQRLLTQG